MSCCESFCDINYTKEEKIKMLEEYAKSLESWLFTVKKCIEKLKIKDMKGKRKILLNLILDYDDFLGFFEKEDVDKIKGFSKHPLKEILNIDNFLQSVSPLQMLKRIDYLWNLNHAFKIILEKDPNYKNYLNPRLFKDDFFNAISALAEIKVYGNLVEACKDSFFDVQSSKDKNGPDFRIYRNGKKIASIEVYSKGLPDEEVEKEKRRNTLPLNKWSDDLYDNMIERVDTDGSKVEIVEYQNSVFGKNKKHSDYQNAIYKISKIKDNKENQFDEDVPAILWIDFSSCFIRCVIGEDENHCQPLFFYPDGNRTFIASGICWYAFYGLEGLPISEGDCTPIHSSIITKNMTENGRFRKKGNKVDFVVFSLLNKMIAFENPFSKKQINDRPLLDLFSNLRDFSFKDSWLNWPLYDLKNRVGREIQVINEICGKKKQSI
jgi:hypothetical protein